MKKNASLPDYGRKKSRLSNGLKKLGISLIGIEENICFLMTREKNPKFYLTAEKFLFCLTHEKSANLVDLLRKNWKHRWSDMEKSRVLSIGLRNNSIFVNRSLKMSRTLSIRQQNTAAKKLKFLLIRISLVYNEKKTRISPIFRKKKMQISSASVIAYFIGVEKCAFCRSSREKE